MPVYPGAFDLTPFLDFALLFLLLLRNTGYQLPVPPA
jgi:hypothetical protein